MTGEERRSITNGIWCCAIHADIIDSDVNRFSVSTLREWKKLAEASAYHEIDSSLSKIDYPTTLVQLGDDIVFRSMWFDLNVEEKRYDFRIISFVYGSLAEIELLVKEFESREKSTRYVVVESQGFGSLLAMAPELKKLDDYDIVTIRFEERTEYSLPSESFDLPLSFTENGMDLSVTEVEPGIVSVPDFVSGKDAVVQSIQMLLGTKRGGWALDRAMGSYLFRYYRDHHMDHELLTSLIKLEVSRLSSVPERGALNSEELHIPVSSIDLVDSITIKGHSDNLIEVILRLHFTDKTYYENSVSIPATFKDRGRT